MLDDSEIDIIRETAEVLAELNLDAVNAFYARLFEVAPGVRPLFPADMFTQSEKLWNTIVTVVNAADNIGTLRPVLLALGERHVGFGALPEHYPVVSEVLIDTMKTACPTIWTGEHHAVWTKVMDYICSTMIEGAAKRSAA